MESKTRIVRGGRSGNRRTAKTSTRTARRPRRAIAARRTRRAGRQITRKNRLARAEGSLRRNRQGGGNYRRGFRRNLFFRRPRRNLRLRKLFVGGLPKFVGNSKLYGLFRSEGAIVGCRIAYDKMGLSRGFGEVEFNHPRDAWRCIQKWNNTTYYGNTLRIEYRKRRRNNGGNRRGFGGQQGQGRNYERRDYNRDFRERRNDDRGYRREYGYNGGRSFGGNYQNRGFRGSFGGRFRGRGRGRGGY